jgi:hypothetical protein
MTDVIATREYILEKDGQGLPIYVELGKPALHPAEPPIWYCPFSVVRPSGTEVSPALGADSLDALTQALSALRIVLEGIGRTGKLTVHGNEGTFIELI